MINDCMAASGGFTQTGTTIATDFKRWNGDLSVTHKATDWFTLNSNLSGGFWVPAHPPATEAAFANLVGRPFSCCPASILTIRTVPSITTRLSFLLGDQRPIQSTGHRQVGSFPPWPTEPPGQCLGRSPVPQEFYGNQLVRRRIPGSRRKQL